jgi:hypothetical protein
LNSKIYLNSNRFEFQKNQKKKRKRNRNANLAFSPARPAPPPHGPASFSPRPIPFFLPALGPASTARSFFPHGLLHSARAPRSPQPSSYPSTRALSPSDHLAPLVSTLSPSSPSSPTRNGRLRSPASLGAGPACRGCPTPPQIGFPTPYALSPIPWPPPNPSAIAALLRRAKLPAPPRTCRPAAPPSLPTPAIAPPRHQEAPQARHP